MTKQMLKFASRLNGSDLTEFMALMMCSSGGADFDKGDVEQQHTLPTTGGAKKKGTTAEQPKRSENMHS